MLTFSSKWLGNDSFSLFIYSLQSADKATKTIRDPLPTSEERSTLVSLDKEF